ncbi:hypothetical protein CHU95_03350 [Niveispirillum lacus]|uniref:Uncharacterized protein n=1 Tax=Niveispirillum lacus TaxID=1981099 RepID=A0A255Z5W7_9PROT|nr:hypothetical protein [Niveispirillum lacus]OYQ36821.1 hypothetical protein CHU95_03350 [Niveispirillum lacus]
MDKPQALQPQRVVGSEAEPAMTADDLDTNPFSAPVTDEQWEILGTDLLSEARAERVREANEEGGRLAKFDADRAAILALPDTALLLEMQRQYARWDAATDDVAEWSWHPRFTGPDDPGIEAWRRRATQQYERLSFIGGEVNRRGIGPASPAPGPEVTAVVDSMPAGFFNDLVLGDADLNECGPRR